VAKRRRTIGWAIAALVVCPSLKADPRADTLRSLLNLERRNLATEVRRLTAASRRLESAIGDLTAASRAVAEGVGKDEAAMAEAADGLSRASGSVSSAALEERLALERVALLRRRVGDLEREAAGAGARREEDPISGDWHIRVDPGAQEGDLHLSLEGTLVGGSYSLEGAMTGSVRGTFVGDRLRFDRIDSRLGFSAVFYGRLLPDGTVTGTWEATELSGGGSSSGTWSAVKKNEGEEP
jgi:hypothetical protein